MANRIGLQLGHYRLIQLLGEGGFAEVYLGEHIHLGTRAAIKVLRTQLSGEMLVENFRLEARTIAQLVHPHIIRVLDFGIEEGTPFLVMDYAPKGTLRQLHPPGSQLSLSVVVSYVKQVADALQYSHDQKLIHRDIKPENMLLGPHDEILLSDFGIAAMAHSEHSMVTQDLAGTVPYMAPEQIQGKPQPASDQYALAIVIYEWLCGQLPFTGTLTELIFKHCMAPPPPLSQFTPVPSQVEQVIMHALAKDPHLRFARIQDFSYELEQAYKLTQTATLADSASPSAQSGPGGLAAPHRYSVVDQTQPVLPPGAPAYPSADSHLSSQQFSNGGPALQQSLNVSQSPQSRSSQPKLYLQGDISSPHTPANNTSSAYQGVNAVRSTPPTQQQPQQSAAQASQRRYHTPQPPYQSFNQPQRPYPYQPNPSQPPQAMQAGNMPYRAQQIPQTPQQAVAGSKAETGDKAQSTTGIRNVLMVLGYTALLWIVAYPAHINSLTVFRQTPFSFPPTYPVIWLWLLLPLGAIFAGRLLGGIRGCLAVFLFEISFIILHFSGGNASYPSSVPLQASITFFIGLLLAALITGSLYWGAHIRGSLGSAFTILLGSAIAGAGYVAMRHGMFLSSLDNAAITQGVVYAIIVLVPALILNSLIRMIAGK